MRDPEHAQQMLALANKDLKALRGMQDVEIFDDAIFGFHAQQTVEKSLKAWLSSAGIAYSKIHDLEELFSLLEKNGQHIPAHFRNLTDLTDFAVQFRYELFEYFETGLDRAETIDRVSKFSDYVEQIIVNAETAEEDENDKTN
jgi:HEPN domain-containing protein